MNLNSYELVANKRDQSKTTRVLRDAGITPGVIYGKNCEAISIELNTRELDKIIASKTLFSQFTKLKIEKKEYLVYAKVVQKHPVTERTMHIDFQVVEKDQVIKFKVPVLFQNKEICEPIKLGGVLNMIHRRVEVKGMVKDLPNCISFDLKNLEAKAKINTKIIELPKGVEFTAIYVKANVASILAGKKKAAEVEEEAAAESAE